MGRQEEFSLMSSNNMASQNPEQGGNGALYKEN